MKDIDWSKAPEWATHVNPNSKPDPDWYRVGETVLVWQWHKSAWVQSIMRADFLLNNLVPIEESRKPWTGEGLPPVGTVCEVEPHNTYWGLVTLDPVEMQVAGYFEDLVWLIDVNGMSHWTRADKADFRPRRTPEQIAAEEREKAVDQILDDFRYTIGSCTHLLTRDQAERLYDAGYRKAEGGAQ